MELDDIKSLLQVRLEENVLLKSADVLHAAIHQPAFALTVRIKRSIWFEFAASLFCAVAATAAWFFYTALYIHLFCALTILCCIIFCSCLGMLYKKIVFYESAAVTVREKLQLLVNIIKRFSNLYFSISIGLLPVIFIYGLISGYLDVSQKGLLPQFHWSAGLIFYSVAYIGWSVIIYYFTGWYIRRLYGMHLANLEQQLKEIANG